MLCECWMRERSLQESSMWGFPCAKLSPSYCGQPQCWNAHLDIQPASCFLLQRGGAGVTSMKTFLSYKTQRRVAPGSSLASVLVLWKSPWGNAVICQANNLDYGARPCGCWPGGQKHASFLTTELINHQPIRRLHPLLSVLLPPAPTRPTHHLAVAKSLNSFSIILSP